MRVPIRKPGKYTHLRADPHMTEEKYSELKYKLEKLKKISRPKAAEEVRFYAQDGDFSENAPYQIAKGRLRGINQKIIEIEDLLKRAVLIKLDAKKDFVRLGNTVKIELDGRLRTYQILGSAETSPDLGVISHNSPIGSALMGKRAGDILKVILGGKEKIVKILEIL